MLMINVGTAGWSIPRDEAGGFPQEGSSLERYAARFPVGEINSSFHRPHRHSTWERWRDSVPDGFRFSVKVPKTITHQAKLVDCRGLLDDFLAQATALREALAVLLVQLPPKLAFDASTASAFFADMKARTSVSIACEPRHESWFSADADALLAENEVARVAADPALSDAAARPGGWPALRYWRLHGSPVIYRSSYAERVADYAKALQADADGRETWCIFDNTASSAAVGDALSLIETLSGSRSA